MLNARYHCDACEWDGEVPSMASDLSGGVGDHRDVLLPLR
jgi:hypothetical protein